MEITEMIKSKRSIKKYQNKPVEHPLIEQIVEAGLYAPSGRNGQNVKMLVVENKELVQQIAKINASILGIDTDPFYGAPVVIVVFANRNCSTYMEDGSLVMANLMLEAHFLGVDSCWIHRAKETFETPDGRKLAKEWGIPDEYIGIGNCILGYHEGPYPTPSPRKSDRVYYAK